MVYSGAPSYPGFFQSHSGFLPSHSLHNLKQCSGHFGPALDAGGGTRIRPLPWEWQSALYDRRDVPLARDGCTSSCDGFQTGAHFRPAREVPGATSRPPLTFIPVRSLPPRSSGIESASYRFSEPPPLVFLSSS